MLVDNPVLSPYQAAELVSDAGIMREFRASQYYAVFCKYSLMLVEQFQARALAGTKDEFEYWKGAYNGARDASQLPESVIAMSEAFRKEREDADRKI